MTIRIGWHASTLGWSELLPLPPEPLETSIPAPMVRDWTANTWVIRAPFDLNFGCRPDGNGGLDVRWLDEGFDMDPNQLFIVTRPEQWSAPGRPALQLKLNNLFVADQPVWMETCGPVLHWRREPWPGVYVGGRLDIYRWTRPLQWVFEWHDPERPLRIRRGDPIKYVRFFAPDPAARFEMEQLEYTREVEQAVFRCARNVPFRRNVLSLMDDALKRRPRRYLPARNVFDRIRRRLGRITT